jgi:hypothetical protein
MTNPDSPTGNAWRATLAVLSTGYILMFFSEFLFVNVLDAQGNMNVPLWDAGIMWLFYSLNALALLVIVTHFRVRQWWALFLAGAVYGWLLEGVIVDTMYDNFPLYISFTSLAWHVPLDVLLGWYAVNRLLKRGSLRQTALTAAGIGLFWGTWAIWPWAEIGVMQPPGEFALFTWAAALPLIGAYAVWQWAGVTAFNVPRWMLWALLAAFGGMFAFNIVPMRPLAVLILPPLLLLAFYALERNRRAESPGSLLAAIANSAADPRRRFIHYAALLLMPLIASAAYALYAGLGVIFPTNIPVFIVMMPGGFILFGWSVWRAIRRGGPATT